jgi:hypothetical protein
MGKDRNFFDFFLRKPVGHGIQNRRRETEIDTEVGEIATMINIGFRLFYPQNNFCCCGIESSCRMMLQCHLLGYLIS